MARNNNRGIQQQPARSEVVTQRMSQSFSGPIPPPALLEKYNEIIPNAAERILIMAEKQQEHRQELERKVIFSNAGSQKEGLYLGFVVAMTAIIGGIVLVAKGKEATGLTAVITALAALVGVFIYGKHEQKKDMKNKPKALDKA